MVGVSNRNTFLREAEMLLRGKVRNNPDLLVWRGRYPHKRLSAQYEYDTVIVGMSDDKNSEIPPTLPIMLVWLEDGGGGNASIDFKIGSDRDTFQTVPFGGGWNPLEEVDKVADELRRL